MPLICFFLFANSLSLRLSLKCLSYPTSTSPSRIVYNVLKKETHKEYKNNFKEDGIE